LEQRFQGELRARQEDVFAHMHAQSAQYFMHALEAGRRIFACFILLDLLLFEAQFFGQAFLAKSCDNARLNQSLGQFPE